MTSSLSGSASRYVILDEIARGGMGVVYRARDTDLNRVLALKLLLEEHQDDPEMHRRFLDEAQIASQLQHPSIVPIHDVGRFADNRPFFTMKLVQGRTLVALLSERRDPADDLPRFLAVFEQVCQAMAYAHSRGVIHRDLKPGNVMVGAFGEVHVMDWGLATTVASGWREPPVVLREQGAHATRSPSHLSIGTPAYVAPEQAKGDPVDERADVFGLGGILCEILTGEPTYTLPRSAAVWLLNQDRDLRGAHERLARCSADAELVDLARQCLEESPAHRPRDATAVAQRLLAYRAGVQERLHQAEVERAAAQSRVETTAARAAAERRAGQLLLLLAFGVLLLVVLVGSAAWVWHDRRQATRQRVEMLLSQAAILTGDADQPDGHTLAHWREAAVLLDQAGQILDSGWSTTDLRSRVNRQRQRIRRERLRLEGDHQLLQRLAELHLRKDDEDQRLDTEARYQAAFAGFGFDVEKMQFEELAERLRAQSPAVLEEAVIALDEWARDRRRRLLPAAQWRPLVQLAALLDDNAWRDEVRQCLLETPASGTNSEMLPLDVLAGLTGPLLPQMLVTGVETARRRGRLLQLARQADVAKLPPPSVRLLGGLLAQEGEFAEAIRLLRHAQRRHLADAWLNHDLAFALHHQPRPQLDEAIRYYHAARALRPEIGHALAHALQDKGEFQEAVAVFEELTRTQPRNARHHHCLGLLYVRLNRPTDAEREMRLACQWDASWSLPCHQLGVLLARQNQFGEAEKLFREAIRLEPTALLPRVNLGTLLGRQSRWDEATRVLEQAYALAPRDVGVLFNLALARDELNRPDESIRTYHELLAIAPEHPEANTNLGQLLYRHKDVEGALRHLRQALETRPDLEEARGSLGRYLLREGRVAESLPHLRWMVARQPGDAGRHITLAIALEKSGEYDEVIRLYRETMKRFPNNAILPYNLANILHSLGQSDEVQALYRRAVEINPEYPEALCNLGHRLRDQGDFRAALELLKRGHESGQRRGGWLYPSAHWVRECEGLLAVEDKVPAFLAGTQTPGDTTEALLAVLACRCKQLHAGSVQLLQQAVRRDPLTWRSRLCDRSEAATSAILAAAGQSKDAGELQTGRRVELRLLALTWLTAELRTAKPDVREWLRRPAWASVRDEDALRRLPEEERQAWQRFWRAVRER